MKESCCSGSSAATGTPAELEHVIREILTYSLQGLFQS